MTHLLQKCLRARLCTTLRSTRAVRNKRSTRLRPRRFWRLISWCRGCCLSIDDGIGLAPPPPGLRRHIAPGGGPLGSLGVALGFGSLGVALGEGLTRRKLDEGATAIEAALDDGAELVKAVLHPPGEPHIERVVAVERDRLEMAGEGREAA